MSAYPMMVVAGLLAATLTPAAAAPGADPAADGARSLYVTGLVSDDVPIFGVRADGSLAPGPRHVPTGGGTRGIVLSPDGRTAYVAVGFDPRTGQDANRVVAYRVGAGGGLTDVPGSSFPLDGGEQPALEALAISPNQAPVADFVAAPGAAGRPTTFDATASHDPDGRVARFDWDFGDGTLLPDGGPTPTKQYSTAGTFTVKLTVTDDEGCSTRIVYTGTSALCNGMPTARAIRTIVVHQ